MYASSPSCFKAFEGQNAIPGAIRDTHAVGGPRHGSPTLSPGNSPGDPIPSGTRRLYSLLWFFIAITHGNATSLQLYSFRVVPAPPPLFRYTDGEVILRSNRVPEVATSEFIDPSYLPHPLPLRIGSRSTNTRHIWMVHPAVGIYSTIHLSPSSLTCN